MEFLPIAEEVARAAGALIRSAHEKRYEGIAAASIFAEAVEAKPAAADGASKLCVDLVTATDKAAEDLIIGTLRARFPTHNFVGEESYDSGSAGPGALSLAEGTYTWIVDPLDVRQRERESDCRRCRRRCCCTCVFLPCLCFRCSPTLPIDHYAAHRARRTLCTGGTR